VRMVMQELIELEATQTIGAGPYERTQARITERKGLPPVWLTRGVWVDQAADAVA